MDVHYIKVNNNKYKRIVPLIVFLPYYMLYNKVSSA